MRSNLCKSTNRPNTRRLQAIWLDHDVFRSYAQKILCVLAVLYVFARLAACDLEIGIDPEPIDINLVISLEMLNECDMRVVGFAIWLDSTYEGGDIICTEEPSDACMLWLSPDCGVAIEPVGKDYCVFPLIAGCAFNDVVPQPDAE